MAEVQPENPQAEALSQLQKPRITDEDCEILSVFKDNPELILALRNLLFGFTLVDKELYIIEDQLDNDAVKAVIRKSILPELQSNIPLGQNIDLWATKDVSEATEESFKLDYKVKELLVGMVETSLKRLDNLNNDGVDLKPKKDLAYLKARIGYINHTTRVLQDLFMNAKRPTSKKGIDPRNSNK